MELVLQIIQILSGCTLIFLILLHSPKGGGMGMFTSAAEMFSTQSSAEAGLNRVTYTVAIIFFVVSIILGTGILNHIFQNTH